MTMESPAQGGTRILLNNEFPLSGAGILDAVNFVF